MGEQTMNDLHHACEPWAERISLAAAGCLSPDEEREIRRHIETCFACRERSRQLTELCGVLAGARLPADRAATAIVERVMSAVATVRTETIHPTLLARSLNNWRWMMHSRVSRVAAAVISVLAVGGVAFWFHGAGTTPAYADFVKPILEAKSVKYKETYELEGHIGKTSEVMVLAPDRTREESREEKPDNRLVQSVTIRDPRKGKELYLDHKNKTATVYTFDNMPKELASANWFSGMRNLLHSPSFKREPLGEKAFDGYRAVGTRLNYGRDNVMDLWSDPETGLLIRVEMSEQRSGKEMKVTMSDFEFNVDLDESLFSLDPPAGYTTRDMQIDSSPKEEKDLIEMLRQYGQQGGGVFPDAIDPQTPLKSKGTLKAPYKVTSNKKFEGKSEVKSEMKIQKKSEIKVNSKWEEGKRQPANEEDEQPLQNSDTNTKITRGLSFIMQMPPEAAAHYAGKGVKLGDALTPIFWYVPKDAKQGRVIYGDLSVKDVPLDQLPPDPEAKNSEK
jgi:outer membrane lipoprotein-sorting protein